MSLLKRIESARPAGQGEERMPVPAAGGPGRDVQGEGGQGGPPAGAAPAAPRLVTQLPARESFRDVKFRIQNRVIQDLDPKLDLTNQVEVRRQIEEIFSRVIDEEGLALTRAERVRMLEQITDEIIGLGPLEPLLRDDSVSEIMVNGPRQVYIERAGKLELTNVVFQNDDHVMRIIDRIIAPIGRRVDESSPMVDARLTDGSRVNAIIPPLSLVGPVITIRKFAASPFTTEDLVRFGTVHRRQARLVAARVGLERLARLHRHERLVERHRRLGHHLVRLRDLAVRARLLLAQILAAQPRVQALGRVHQLLDRCHR